MFNINNKLQVRKLNLYLASKLSYHKDIFKLSRIDYSYGDMYTDVSYSKQKKDTDKRPLHTLELVDLKDSKKNTLISLYNLDDDLRYCQIVKKTLKKLGSEKFIVATKNSKLLLQNLFFADELLQKANQENKKIYVVFSNPKSYIDAGFTKKTFLGFFPEKDFDVSYIEEKHLNDYLLVINHNYSMPTVLCNANNKEFVESVFSKQFYSKSNNSIKFSNALDFVFYNFLNEHKEYVKFKENANNNKKLNEIWQDYFLLENLIKQKEQKIGFSFFSEDFIKKQFDKNINKQDQINLLRKLIRYDIIMHLYFVHLIEKMQGIGMEIREEFLDKFFDFQCNLNNDLSFEFKYQVKNRSDIEKIFSIINDSLIALSVANIAIDKDNYVLINFSKRIFSNFELNEGFLQMAKNQENSTIIHRDDVMQYFDILSKSSLSIKEILCEMLYIKFVKEFFHVSKKEFLNKELSLENIQNAYDEYRYAFDEWVDLPNRLLSEIHANKDISVEDFFKNFINLTPEMLLSRILESKKTINEICVETKKSKGISNKTYVETQDNDEIQNNSKIELNELEEAPLAINYSRY